MDSVIENAVAWATGIAEDGAHGYDQASRQGPDYDCSSLVINAFERAGLPVKAAGAGYTGNMRSAFLKCGFEWLPASSERRRGDVLLNEARHTALCVDADTIVHAAANELGGASGGESGDQTGREICLRGYYTPSYGWDGILRYTGAEPAAQVCRVTARVCRRGDRGGAVRAMQALLISAGASCGPCGADGSFGPDTEAGLLACQAARGLETDGVCGPASWGSLIN